MKINDHMDYRDISVECDLGPHVCRVFRGARVGNLLDRNRRLDSEQKRSDGRRNGHTRPTGSRQEVELISGKRARIGFIATIPGFYVMVYSETISS